MGSEDHRHQAHLKTDDGRVIILGGTDAEVTRIADNMAAAAMARREEPQIAVELGFRPAGAALIPIVGQTEVLRNKLARLGAKAVIEWIGMTAGVQAALHPALDSLRRFARYREGEAAALGITAHATPGSYWLPNTGVWLYVDPGETPTIPDLEPGKQPDGSKKLDRLVHGVMLTDPWGKPHCQLMLFSIFNVLVPLPTERQLPIRTDARDILNGAIVDLNLERARKGGALGGELRVAG